jgi:hypothetical protein
MKNKKFWLLILLACAASAAQAQSYRKPSSVNAAGASSIPIQAPSVVTPNLIKATGGERRTGGTQFGDFTYGSFSLPSNANATGKACSLDTTAYAAKAVWTSATSTQYTGCILDGTWDMSGVTNFFLDVGVPATQTATSTSFYVLLSSDATISPYTNYANSANLAQNVPKMDRTWITFSKAGMTPHGTVNWSAIKHIEIRIIRSATSTAETGTFYIYGLWGDITHKTQVMVSHDDARISWYTNAFPRMKALGLRGTLFVNGTWIGAAGYMTLANLREAEQVGFTIASHGWAHTALAVDINTYSRGGGGGGATATAVTGVAHGKVATNSVTVAGCDEAEYNGTRTVATAADAYTMTWPTAGTNSDLVGRGWCYLSGAVPKATAKAEIRRNKEWLIANGFVKGWMHFSYPSGQWDPDVITTLQEEGALTARTILSTRNQGLAYVPYGTGILSSNLAWSYPAYSMDSASSSHTPADILTQIDNAVAIGADIAIYGHGVVDSSPSATEQLTADFQTVVTGLAQRVAAGTIKVVTVDEWYNSK